MSINFQVPADSGEATRRLAADLQQMYNNPAFSDEDVKDATISGLFALVGKLEREVDTLRAAANAARQQAVRDDMAVRSVSAGGR